ncbi:MAG: hypothetical protein AAFQ68_25195 [Bacteroidota bacterium]
MAEIPEQMPHGEDRKELLDLYKTFLNSIEVTTNRRQQSNQFFTGLLTALLGAVGFALSNESLKGQLETQGAIMLAVGILGLILSGIWRQYLESTIKLSRAKFHILNPMEKNFVVQPFSEEDKLLKKQNYVSLGKLERILPLLMMLPYTVLIVYSFVLLSKAG